MKNIHLIPTDKPSRLFKVSGELKLTRNFDFYNGSEYQHIYITNDEEIKEGDYFLYDGTKIRYKSNGTEYHGRDLCHISGNHRYPVSESKKIILTTDQDLIKNGVQSIDDEFLEWFIKNPSCESVEIEIKPMFPMYSTFIESIDNPPFYGNLKRKIIIPQEEPKQVWEQIIETCGGKEAFIESAGLKPKQETIEEAAEKYRNYWLETRGLTLTDTFIAGAKWQAERMYSEEDKLEQMKNRFEVKL